MTMDVQRPSAGTAWIEKQERFSASSTFLFDKNAGEEVTIYQDAMAVLYECFEEDLINKVGQTNLRVSVAMLSQAYQQLVSSWSDLRSGRLLAATSNWRSIAEAPAFVLAAAEDSSFALEWADTERRTTIKPEKARKIAKRRLNRIDAKSGDSLAKTRP